MAGTERVRTYVFASVMYNQKRSSLEVNTQHTHNPSTTQRVCQDPLTDFHKNYFSRWWCWWLAETLSVILTVCHACLINVSPQQSLKMLSKQKWFFFFFFTLKNGKVFWILFQFSLRLLNDMGNCVPHACHSLHPIDWELSTQERAVGHVAVYLWWWLQPINFDGCCFKEKTMGVGMMASQPVFCRQHV